MIVSSMNSDKYNSFYCPEDLKTACHIGSTDNVLYYDNGTRFTGGANQIWKCLVCTNGHPCNHIDGIMNCRGNCSFAGGECALCP